VTDVIAFDKDSTLADTSPRHWMAEKIKLQEGSHTWADYSRACVDDKPIESTRRLMYLLAPHYPLYIMSGANDCPEARQWLLDHRFPYNRLFFRQEGDFTENGLLKVQWIRELREQNINVKLLVEDWRETAEFVEAETGVPCLLVNPRYPEDAPWGGPQGSV
jgi:hypothetical protein